MFDKLIALVRGQTNASVVGAGANGRLIALQSDLYGNAFVRPVYFDAGGGVFVEQGYITTPAMEGNTRIASVVANANYLLVPAGTDLVLSTGIVIADAIDAGAFTGVTQASAAFTYGYNGATQDRIRSVAGNADGQAALTLGQLVTQNRGALFNGTTFDRQRNNVPTTVLASAIRAATNQSADIVNYNGRGLHLVFDITVVPTVDTVTLTIQGKDELSGKYYTILAGAAQVAVGTVVMRIYPSLTAVANLTASDILPRTWRVSVTHSAATNFTYSVGASVIL